MIVTLAERLERNSQQEGACRVWTGCRTNDGYGRINVKGEMILAHRAAWVVKQGYIPQGLCVLHHCDNPPCIQLDHLFLGTHTENIRDMWLKGRQGSRTHPERHPRGENHGRAKLTKAKVASIRTTYALGLTSQQDLAHQFGVGSTAIWKIVNGKTWQEGGVEL